MCLQYVLRYTLLHTIVILIQSSAENVNNHPYFGRTAFLFVASTSPGIGRNLFSHVRFLRL